MKIAQYKHLEYGYIYNISESEFDYHDNSDEYIRISETIEVDFPMLSNVDINSKKVAIIDEKIKKALAVLETLEQQKAELLAIPDISEG